MFIHFDVECKDKLPHRYSLVIPWNCIKRKVLSSDREAHKSLQTNLLTKNFRKSGINTMSSVLIKTVYFEASFKF